MTIAELIEGLAQMLQVHGNIPVFFVADPSDLNDNEKELEGSDISVAEVKKAAHWNLDDLPKRIRIG